MGVALVAVVAYLNWSTATWAGRAGSATHVRFICDTAAEMNALTDLIDGDRAFVNDTSTRYKRVAGAWAATSADAINAVNPSAGSVAWGGITGTLSNQTDLQTSLNGKQASGTYATGTGTASGTNTGDQTITLTGDVTGTGTGTFAATVAAASVTLAKMANMATSSLIYRKTAGAGVPEVNTLATLKTDLALVKADVGLANADNTTDANKPVSTATQTALNLKANLTPTGSTVTQATSKATGVTINTQSGAITMNAAALAAAAEVTFIVTNSSCGANDLPYAVHKSAGTAGAYNVQCNTVAAGSFRITVGNWSAGSLSEAIVLQFLIHKGAVA